ncbi:MULTISPECIES: hypothetical protein [unclassified Bacillus cereus group]|uniref:hypothetical protein n=1 Tax=unclassified Bacillus cereus group TaxID=2750818 RepID=UPI001F578A5D|nr:MULTISPECIES: hypothetical protein [unclassified Bacillus cereus group]
MKTIQEIQDEMQSCSRTIRNYKDAFNNKRIPEDVLQSVVLENESMILSLNSALEMTAEQEIRNKIKDLDGDENVIRDSYKKGEIDRQVFLSKLLQNSSQISALKWVLGENDRFD